MLEIYLDVRRPCTIAKSPFLALDKHCFELSRSNVQSAANSLVLMWTFVPSELQQTFYSQRSIRLAMLVVV